MSTQITVVGGTYGEICCFPARTVHRGSGGRAAAILTSLGNSVTLRTISGPLLGAEFQTIANRLGYTLEAQQGHDDVWFRYRFPLGQPTIHPNIRIPVAHESEVRTDRALVFGMVETRPIVHAKRVVYDPQDGSLSRPFSANGSTAEDLALVMSYSEAKALTGVTEPDDMANRLLDDPAVTVVVIKCGPQGALVKTRDTAEWVRAFPSRKVYKIGSGDAFSAGFAHAWLIEGRDAVSSAWFASRIAAAYVETAQDRFDPSSIASFRLEAEEKAKKWIGKGPRPIPDTQIYLASPFFNTAQQWLVDEAREALLDMGFKVFSPVHDIGIGTPEEVAPADLLALQHSGLVLALLDGLDSGTIFEVGYARALGIPVVGIAEAVDANALTMILGSGCAVANDLTTGLYSACWQLMGDV